MSGKERYQQSALDFHVRQPEEPYQAARSEADNDDEPLPDLSRLPSIATDPEGMPRGLASHRLPNDFWGEFHLEWEFRERNGMLPVSPAEFADMRDFSDRLIEPEDAIWPPPAQAPYECKQDA
jgi:hypothetical protein